MIFPRSMFRTTSTRLLRHCRMKTYSPLLYVATNPVTIAGKCTAVFSFRSLCTKILPDIMNMLNAPMADPNSLSQFSHRSKLATRYQDKFIQEFIESHDTATCEEWHNLLDQVFKLQYGSYQVGNIDGKLMACCEDVEKLNLARSYLMYMKSQKRKFNVAVISSFLKVCYACRESLIDSDKQRISQFTDFFIRKYRPLCLEFCDGIIHGLVLQNKIEEALDILNKTEDSIRVKASSFAPVIDYLLECKTFNQASNLMEEAFMKNYFVPNNIFIKWIQVFRDDRKKLDKLLSIFQSFNFKPLEIICNHLIVAYQDLPAETKLIATHGTFDNRGCCSVCGGKLKPVELKEEEFVYLRTAILENVLVDGDIFKNTTPAELKRFLQFVHSTGPIDIVIDGPNVGYMCGPISPPKQIVETVDHVLKHFGQNNLKMLLIGKNHMRNWPNFMSVLRENNVKFFFIEGQADDAFMLYTTMFNGLNCKFVSRDRMENESLKLDAAQYIIFKRWLQTHQLYITKVLVTKSYKANRVYIRDPVSFETIVQPSQSGGWHIPYHDENTLTLNEFHHVHSKWLCLRPACFLTRSISR